MAIKISGSTIINDNRCLINYGQVHNSLGNISGSTSIDLTIGNYVSATLVGDTTFSFINPIASPNAFGLILELTNGGTFNITWPNSVKWPGGIAPSLTLTGVDILVFLSDDGGITWRGAVSILDSK